MDVKPDAKPRFAKALSVPIRLKENVKAELNRLENEGQITKVFSSDWASPIVCVHKSDGNLRICGDLSVSVNKYLDTVHFPLPSIDDVIARVGNAAVFSKLDVSNAFIQLPLDEYSKQFTTINTTEGLFRYNFLPFGLTSSSGIFQAYMSKLLNDVPDVIVYQDVILVLSVDVQSHEKTLHSVLSKLRTAGVK